MIISKHFGFIALCHLDSSPYIRLNDILDRSVASAQNPGLGARRGKGGGVEVGDASEYQAANVSAVLRCLGGRYFSLRPQAADLSNWGRQLWLRSRGVLFYSVCPHCTLSDRCAYDGSDHVSLESRARLLHLLAANRKLQGLAGAREVG
jgi:hypothetical protein